MLQMPIYSAAVSQNIATYH